MISAAKLRKNDYLLQLRCFISSGRGTALKACYVYSKQIRVTGVNIQTIAEETFDVNVKVLHFGRGWNIVRTRLLREGMKM